MRPSLQCWTHPTVADAPVALVLHGTGSNPDFVRRTFLGATHARGHSLVTYRLRGHGLDATDSPPYDMDQHLADLAEALQLVTPTVLGGISLGAHLTALIAAVHGLPDSVTGMLLAIPAWTGAPEVVAHANAVQADQIAAIGITESLRLLDEALAGSDVHWVYDEMACTWREHTDERFEAILRATAASSAPSPEQLARILVPCGISASEDDPLHPLTAAATWRSAIPRSALLSHTMKAFGLDRGTLGENAWSALEAASL